MAEYQNIKYGVQDRIAVITVEPSAGQRLRRRTLSDLEGAFDEATTNPRSR